MAVSATATKLHLSSAEQRPSLLHLAAVAVLCSISYLLGIWHHNGFSTAPAASAGSSSVSITTAVSCASLALAATSSSFFSTHHTAEAMEAEAAPLRHVLDVCPTKYSEYTPCEDVEHSLRFLCDRLIYRERHCPKSDGERLWCLVPAP
jgi:hypothetical protein